MAASGSLASQYVEFFLKGFEVVQQGIATIKAGLDKVTAATEMMNAKLQATPAAIGAAVAGFQMLTNAARSWVSAGLAGTGVGNLMHTQFTLLSQQIAGVFVPTINAVTRAVTQLASWFRGLTGDQQGMIRRFVEAAAVMVVVSQVLGRLRGVVVSFVTTMVGGMIAAAASVLTTLLPAIGTLVTALVSGAGIAAAAWGVATAGISVILGLASALVSALFSLGLAGATVGAGLAVGTSSGRAALMQLLAAVRPVVDAIKTMGAQLWATFGPIVSEIGGRLGGLLRDVAGVLMNLFTSAQPSLQAFGGMVVAVGQWMLAAFNAIKPTLVTIGGYIQAVVSKLVSIGAAIGEWIGWRNIALAVGAVIYTIAGIIASILIPIVAAVGGFIAVYIVAPIMALSAVVGAVFGFIGVAIAGAFKVGMAVLEFFKSAWDATFGQLVAPVMSIIDTVWGVWQMWYRVGSSIIGMAWDIGKILIGTIWETLKSIASVILGPILQAFGLAGGVGSGVFGGIADFISECGAKLQIFAAFMSVVVPAAVESLVHKMGEALAGLIPWFQMVQNGVLLIARGIDAINPLRMLPGFVGIAGVLETTFSALNGGINTAATAMQKFKVAGPSLPSPAGAAAARPGTTGPGRERTDVGQVGGGFEEAASMFKRINEAAVKTQGEAAQRELGEKQLGVLEQILKALGMSDDKDRPPVGVNFGGAK